MRIEMLKIPLATSATRLVAGSRPPLGAYDADIIILSLNRTAETLEAVQSALAQRGAAYHITVLDQCSDPETVVEIARTFGKSRNFALYAATENLGVAGGRNLATSLGHGQVIVALDNDATFEGKWVVARAIRAFAERPPLGALGFNILARDGVEPDKFSWGYPARLIDRYRDRFDTTTFVGAGHAIRRATWDAVGGYDESLFFTWEEYDFCLNAIALGWSIGYDGRLAVIHKVSPEGRVAWSANRMTYFVRNRLIIARKWGESWLSLTPRVMGYLLKALFNRRLAATIEGVRAAVNTDLPARRKMPNEMRSYLHAHEKQHRGSWLARLRFEVFAQAKLDP
jgi:GT2 family glycosyltransferase